MNIFFIILIISIVLDAVVLPAVSVVPWFPSFSLVAMPFIFLLSEKKTLIVASLIMASFLWLTTGINLGIIILSFGMMIFFERWFLLQFLKYENWQILALSSLSIIIFGTLVLLFMGLFLGNIRFTSSSFTTLVLSSTILSVGLNLVLRRFIKERNYEKAIF